MMPMAEPERVLVHNREWPANNGMERRPEWKG